VVAFTSFNEENMKIIEKYENLGIIKFKIIQYYEEHVEEGFE
jgi:hypothetical protein